MALKDGTETRDDSALDAYLRTISRFPLLTREDEIELAERIREGDEEALERLVLGNLRFVVSQAKIYSKQGVPLADLINEGNAGLIKAAKRFDEKRGFKFISYAVWWIRQAILQALAEQSRIVRVPLNRVSVLYRLGRASQKLEQELRREPTAEELAAHLGLRESEVSSTLVVAKSHVSLDSPGTGNDDGGLLDALVDDDQCEADEDLIEAAMAREIDAALGALTEREARVIRLYFGIGESDTQTLESIGREFGLTRERIRQIKQKALEKLRVVAGDRELQLFLQH
ncbi:MAG: RNA polymerase subunit sigma [Gemmatimonadetes bacterium]|nr:RNA polymerase subunit sigma [Gemmatimonadota bacterium]